jgi:hypothetical protein
VRRVGGSGGVRASATGCSATVLGFFPVEVGMASDVAPNFYLGLIGGRWSFMPFERR